MNNEQLNFKQPQHPQRIANDKADSLEMLLHRMINRIRQSLELSVILSGTTAEVRSFLRTDRVKIYQFKPDGSGEVVAESRCDDQINHHCHLYWVNIFQRKIFLHKSANFILKIAIELL